MLCDSEVVRFKGVAKSSRYLHNSTKLNLVLLSYVVHPCTFTIARGMTRGSVPWQQIARAPCTPRMLAIGRMDFLSLLSTSSGDQMLLKTKFQMVGRFPWVHVMLDCLWKLHHGGWLPPRFGMRLKLEGGVERFSRTRLSWLLRGYLPHDFLGLEIAGQLSSQAGSGCEYWSVSMDGRCCFRGGGWPHHRQLDRVWVGPCTLAQTCLNINSCAHAKYIRHSDFMRGKSAKTKWGSHAVTQHKISTKPYTTPSPGSKELTTLVTMRNLQWTHINEI